MLRIGQGQARAAFAIVLALGADWLRAMGARIVRGVAGDLLRIKARGLKACDGGIDLGDGLFHGLQVLVNQRIAANPLADFFFGALPQRVWH